MKLALATLVDATNNSLRLPITIERNELHTSFTTPVMKLINFIKLDDVGLQISKWLALAVHNSSISHRADASGTIRPLNNPCTEVHEETVNFINLFQNCFGNISGIGRTFAAQCSDPSDEAFRYEKTLSNL